MVVCLASCEAPTTIIMSCEQLARYAPLKTHGFIERDELIRSYAHKHSLSTAVATNHVDDIPLSATTAGGQSFHPYPLHHSAIYIPFVSARRAFPILFVI